VPDSQWPEQAAGTDAADEPKAPTRGRARRAAAASDAGPA
jgi:hypothetical protein